MKVLTQFGVTPSVPNLQLSPCVVCGVDDIRVFPAGINVIKSKPSVVDFLADHQVVPSERLEGSTDPQICESCYNGVSRCDEFYFAFNGELDQLKRKALMFEARDPLCLLDPRIVAEQPKFVNSDRNQLEKPSSSPSLPSQKIPRKRQRVGRPRIQPSFGQQASQPGTNFVVVFSEKKDSSLDDLEVDQTPSEVEESGEDWQFLEAENSPVDGQPLKNEEDEESIDLPVVVKMECDEEEAPPVPLAPLQKCKYCYFRTRSGESLQEHLQSKHKEIEETGIAEVHRCPKCSETFITKDSLETHMIGGHGSDKPQHPCNFCEESFWSLSKMMAHEDAVHHKGAKKVACERCGDLVFEHRMVNHLASQHRVGCEVVCELCGAVRSRKKTLIQHMARDHGIGQYVPPGKKRPCPHCNRCLTSKEYYFTHLFNMHKIETPELAEYTFTCDRCSKVVIGRAKFEGHMKLHSGDRYVCPTCGYKTRFLGNLCAHRKTVHGYVPVDKAETRSVCMARFLKKAEECDA